MPTTVTNPLGWRSKTQYDFTLGAVTGTKDLNGLISRNEYDFAGRVFRATGAKHFSYTASGALSSMQLGNGRWESTNFNSKSQPVQIALGTTQNTTNLLKLEFDYGSSQNNGIIRSQTVTVPTVGSNSGFTAVQTYTY